MFRTFVLSSTLLISTLSFACLQDNFLPPNKLQIPASEGTGLTKEQYNSIIDKIEKYYSPVVKSLGAQLKIDRKWESNTVNAGTYRDENGTHWHINLYGGFARHKYITEDGFALVICHEIGHHLGGAPKKNISSAAWSSNEGQADYFATLKCLRNIYKDDDNESFVNHSNVPLKVKESCSDSFSSKDDMNLCIRSSMAGLSVAMINSQVQEGSPFPSFETPSTTAVTQTMEGHPEAQCRLDTYFSGAVCEVSHKIPLSQRYEKTGTCHPALGYTRGTRPLCWFSPIK